MHIFANSLDLQNLSIIKSLSIIYYTDIYVGQCMLIMQRVTGLLSWGNQQPVLSRHRLCYFIT